ncbi:MAG: ECF transporter S component [Mycobacterium leprae]
MKVTVRQMAVSGILAAVSLVMGYVPMLGFIPVPTPAGNATIMHIPAILAGVAEGPLSGLFVGFIFGLMSLLRTTTPLFADPLVAILPRLFIGVTAAYTFRLLRRWGVVPGLIGAGLVGTLTNTVLVLGMAVIRRYMAAKVAIGIALVQGLPEAVVGAIVVTIVGAALSRAGYLRWGRPAR